MICARDTFAYGYEVIQKEKYIMENQFFVDSDKLSPQALEKKHRLENDKNSRTDHMAYMDGMEQISPDIRNKVISAMNEYDYGKYTATDVLRALEKDTCSVLKH